MRMKNEKFVQLLIGRSILIYLIFHGAHKANNSSYAMQASCSKEKKNLRNKFTTLRGQIRKMRYPAVL